MPCWRSARMGPNRGSDPEVGSWKDIAPASSVHDVGVRGAAEAIRDDALAHWRLVRAHGVPRDGSLKGMGQVHLVYPSQNRQPYQLAHHILALDTVLVKSLQQSVSQYINIPSCSMWFWNAGVG